jgi:nifR3 family TIM-barrel protein
VLLPGTLRDQIMRVADDDHPVGGQLLGANPETFARAAGELVVAGYDVVDLNFGCPVKKVLGRSRGGFLLSEPRTALEIVSRVHDAIGGRVPLTVKMRRGIADDAQSTEMFWEILEGAFARGVAAVCVHGRTVQQRYVGASKRSFVGEVKRAFPDRTILASGDMFFASDVRDALAETGADGAWIGRGAIGAPWIFRDVAHVLASGACAPPSFSEQRRAVWLHYRESLALYGAERGSRFFRPHAFKYAESHPAGDVVKREMHATRTFADVESALQRWYDEELREDHFGPARARTTPGHLVAAGACA